MPIPWPELLFVALSLGGTVALAYAGVRGAARLFARELACELRQRRERTYRSVLLGRCWLDGSLRGRGGWTGPLAEERMSLGIGRDSRHHVLTEQAQGLHVMFPDRFYEDTTSRNRSPVLQPSALPLDTPANRQAGLIAPPRTGW
jgi:hypothetical protein